MFVLHCIVLCVQDTVTVAYYKKTLHFLNLIVSVVEAVQCWIRKNKTNLK